MVGKSLNSSKMVLNPLYGLFWLLIIQIYYLDIFLDQFWAIFGLRRPKTGQKIKIVHFLLFFVLKFFLNTIFWILFSWMETIYFLGFFSLKKCFIKKYFPIFFFKNFPLVPPMDVFSSFGGPRVVAADLSCSRVASVHCDFVGVCGGAVFWPEKDFLKRVESCLGEVLTPHLSIS